MDFLNNQRTLTTLMGTVVKVAKQLFVCRQAPESFRESVRQLYILTLEVKR